MSMFGTDVPLLDARLGGAGVFTSTAGTDTTHYYTFGFDCKYNGIEVITDSNSVLGDHVTLWTEYNAGQYGWKRYKKFGKEWYLKPNDRTRIILFPTEPSAGVRLAMKYHSTGVNDVVMAVNLFMFVDQAKVNPGALEEGEDW